ncbi:MAG TPA: hypothetical protein VLV83_10075 [Acidobacteriota bacterium]|nr:hypothetical protein [Acidobacteriota bacterium]
MSNLPPYWLALLLVASAGLALTAIYLLRRRWRSSQEGLQQVDAQRHGDYEDRVLPLMVYEDRYPAFGRIAGTVFENFAVGRFLESEDFRRAQEYLTRGAFQPADRHSLEAAMCVIVKTFVSDPEVQYRCPPIDQWVDEFLDEIEIE